jgi:hypothetical protein
VRLSPRGTAATQWPIVPAPKHRWCWLWSNRWSENWQGKPKYSEKTYPPQIPHDLTRARTRVAAVGSRRLTTWSMARPKYELNFISLWVFSNIFTIQNVIVVKQNSLMHIICCKRIKLSLFLLIWHYAMKTYGEWRCSSTILILGIRSRWVVSFTLRWFYSWEKSPQYPLHMRLDVPQSRSCRCARNLTRLLGPPSP